MAVGHYCGPSGAAALSIVNPIWPMMCVLGVILGMGGSIQMSSLRGAKRYDQADTFLRTSVLTGCVCLVVVMSVLLGKMDAILRMLGASETILPLAKEYAFYLVLATPAFLMERLVSGFISNDGNPSLVTKAAIIGGLFNVFGDVYFVYDFGLGLGMKGAGIATALGQVIALCVQLTHFQSEKSKLVWKKTSTYWKDLVLIFKSGIGVAFLTCVEAMAITLYNKKIMLYGTVDDLSVFGTLSSYKWVVGSLFFGMGMATQPLVSSNFGAKKLDRVCLVRRIYLKSALYMSLFFATISFFFAKYVLGMYMSMNSYIEVSGVKAMRLYAIGFVVMGINIVSSYYLDAQLQSKKSLLISLLRELLLVSIMLVVFPKRFGVASIFWIMPLAEGITFVLTIFLVARHPHVKKLTD